MRFLRDVRFVRDAEVADSNLVSSLAKQMTHGAVPHWPRPAVTNGRWHRSGPSPLPMPLNPSRSVGTGLLADEVLVSPAISGQTPLGWPIADGGASQLPGGSARSQLPQWRYTGD